MRPVIFNDRQDAARQLVPRLIHWKGQNPLILAIPRGGLVIGGVLAEELSGELDVVLIRKLGAPFSPELAVGAIDEQAQVYLNRDILQSYNVTTSHIESEKARQLKRIAEQAAIYRKVRPRVPIKDRIVIITDDGIATGATMRSAIAMCRGQEPKRLIIALPVGAPESIAELEKLADELVCLQAPSGFMAVSQFYRVFEQVEDAEVESILQRDAERGNVSHV